MDDTLILYHKGVNIVTNGLMMKGKGVNALNELKINGLMDVSWRMQF